MTGVFTVSADEQLAVAPDGTRLVAERFHVDRITGSTCTNCYFWKPDGDCTCGLSTMTPYKTPRCVPSHRKDGSIIIWAVAK